MSLRPLSRSTWRPLKPLNFPLTRKITTHPKKTPPFPTIPTCPSPTCSCSPTPALPWRLPIDHSKSLNGTMAAYAEQLLICTGKEDWPSRIEDDASGDNLAADVKELVGRGGPYHNILITNSSFPSTPSPRLEVQNSSAYLFPSFKYVPYLPRVSFSSVESLVQGYLLPEKLHPAHDGLSPIHRDRLMRKGAAGMGLWGVKDVEEVVVLICGHGERDKRCGVFGPVLKEEFKMQLGRQDIKILEGPVQISAQTDNQALLGSQVDINSKQSARVGVISHIGGHKFAGNAIVYIPPNWKDSGGKKSQLAGKGIWYGRVEPRHVEGIVRETVLGGRVIEDLFRGGVGRGGEVLRL